MVLYDERGTYFAQTPSYVTATGWPQDQVRFEEGKPKHILGYHPGNDVFSSPPLASEANVRSQNQNLPSQAHYSPINDVSRAYFTGSPEQEAILYGNYFPIPESQGPSTFTNESKNYPEATQQSITSSRNALASQDRKVSFAPSAVRKEIRGYIPDQDSGTQLEHLFHQQFHQQKLKLTQIQTQAQLDWINEQELQQRELKQDQIQQELQNQQQLQEFQQHEQLQDQQKSPEVVQEDILPLLEEILIHSNSMFRVPRTAISSNMPPNETQSSPQEQSSHQNKDANKQWASLLSSSVSQEDTNLSRSSTSRASATSSNSRESNTPVFNRISESQPNFAPEVIHPYSDTGSLQNKQMTNKTWNVSTDSRPANFRQINHLEEMIKFTGDLPVPETQPPGKKPTRGRPRGSKYNVKTTKNAVKSTKVPAYNKQGKYNPLSRDIPQFPGYPYPQQRYAQPGCFPGYQNFPEYPQYYGYPTLISGSSQQELPGYTKQISKPDSRHSEYATVPGPAHQLPQNMQHLPQHLRQLPESVQQLSTHTQKLPQFGYQLPEYSQYLQEQFLQQSHQPPQFPQELYKYARPLFEYAQESPECRHQLPQYADQLSTYNHQLNNQAQEYPEFTQQFPNIPYMPSQTKHFTGPGQKISVGDHQVTAQNQQRFLQIQQVPIQNVQVPVQNQQIPVQNQQISVQNQQIPIQNQQIPVQRQEIPIQDQQLPLQTHQHSIETQQVPNQNQQVPNQNQQVPNQNQQVPNQNQPYSGKLQYLLEGKLPSQSAQPQHIFIPLRLSSPSEQPQQLPIALQRLSSPSEQDLPSSINLIPNPTENSSDEVEYLSENCQEFPLDLQKQKSLQNSPKVPNEESTPAVPSFFRSWHIPEVLPLSESSPESSEHVKSPIVEQIEEIQNPKEMASMQAQNSMDVEILDSKVISKLSAPEDMTAVGWIPAMPMDTASQMCDFEEELQTIGLQQLKQLPKANELRQADESPKASELRKTNQLVQTKQLQVPEVSRKPCAFQVPVSGGIVTVTPVLPGVRNSRPVPNPPRRLVETAEWLLKSPPRLVIDTPNDTRKRKREKLRWHYKPRKGLTASIKRYRSRGIATRSPPLEVYLQEAARNGDIIDDEDDDDEDDEDDHHQNSVLDNQMAVSNQGDKKTQMQKDTMKSKDSALAREVNGYSSKPGSHPPDKIVPSAPEIIANKNSGEFKKSKIHHRGLPNLQSLLPTSDRHK